MRLLGKRGAIFIVDSLTILLGLATFLASQVCVNQERLVKADLPTLSETLTVPFKDHALPEYFYVEAPLDECTSYVAVFANSDLYIGAVNLTGPDGDVSIVHSNLSFRTMTEGTYTLAVMGYYLPPSEVDSSPSKTSYPIPPNTPYPSHSLYQHAATGCILEPKVDETIDVSIVELMKKADPICPYSLLWPAGAGFWVVGAIIPIVMARKRPKNTT